MKTYPIIKKNLHSLYTSTYPVLKQLYSLYYVTSQTNLSSPKVFWQQYITMNNWNGLQGTIAIE